MEEGEKKMEKLQNKSWGRKAQAWKVQEKHRGKDHLGGPSLGVAVFPQLNLAACVQVTNK